MYSATIADVLARYYRSRGEKVLFTTGTDEHGSKIEKAANGNLNEFRNLVSAKYRNLFDKCDISYTDFIRTTQPRHQRSVEYFWNVLKQNNAIKQGKYNGFYSVADEEFLEPNEVENNVSKRTNQPVELISEQNYVFEMLKSKELVEWMKKSVWPESKLNELLNISFESISISRPVSRTRNGISVPNDDSQIIYVWLDALISYLTVLGYPSNKRGMQNTIHVIGKDILRFHGLYWPCFLKAANLSLPEKLLVHGHWTVDSEKMSKSRGNVVCGNEMVEKYGSDAVRFYMLSGGLENDFEWNEELLVQKYNNFFCKQLGNLFLRASKLSTQPKFQYDSRAEKLTNLCVLLKNSNFIEDLKISKQINLIEQIIHEANRLFTVSEPWLSKNDFVFWYVFDAIQNSAKALECITPNAASKILKTKPKILFNLIK